MFARRQEMGCSDGQGREAELRALRARVVELEARLAELANARVAAPPAGNEAQSAGGTDLLRRVLDTLPDPVFVKDDHHRWILLNEAFCAFMGQTRDELLGKSDYDFFPKEEADVFWRLDDLLFETGVTNENQESFTDRAGVEHVISTKKALRRDVAGRKVLVGVIRDVTARVRGEDELRRAHEELETRVRTRTSDLERANAELRESEERFRATFEQAAVGIAHVDADGRLLRVNQRLCDMLGYSSEDLLARTFRDITFPEDLEQSEAAFQGAFQGHSPVSTDKRYVRKDGTLLWTHISTTLAHDVQRRPTYLISAIEDVSARKAAETALEASEAQLRQSQKMEAVGRLAGGVAHDFNNFLLVITMNCELARKLLPVGAPALASLEESLKAAKRAAGVTRQLLAFSRTQLVQIKEVDVNEVVEEMATMSRPLIGADVRFHTELTASPSRVLVDPDQLTQVLMNLVVNARDAMPDGGAISIRTAVVDVCACDPRVPEGLRPGPCVVLTVTDTGCGMDERTKAGLFEPFFTTKPPGKGTGLGLSTVYGIVRQSNGAIAVDSAPGKGTTFRVYLPRIVRPWAATAPARPERTGATPGRTVLLVDDEPAVRRVVGEILTRSGYHVLDAGVPEEAAALARAHQGPLHVLLTDVVMPQMNGRQLASHVRDLHPEARVVYMSGYTPATFLPDADADGPITLLQKPFDEVALLRTLKELVELRRRPAAPT